MSTLFEYIAKAFRYIFKSFIFSLIFFTGYIIFNVVFYGGLVLPGGQVDESQIVKSAVRRSDLIGERYIIGSPISIT